MKYSESKIQQQCVEWYRNNFCLAHHSPQNIIFSVPNEGQNALEQMRKTATGMMAGVSDLIVVERGRVIFIECKDGAGIQKPKQKEFAWRVVELGYEYHLIRSLEQFQAIWQNTSAK
jgi:hypothetical protein